MRTCPSLRTLGYSLCLLLALLAELPAPAQVTGTPTPILPCPTKLVTYNSNSATSGSAPSDPTLYRCGKSVTVLGNPGSLARTGYTFAGWNTQANGSGTTYTQGQTLTLAQSNVTLYAKWDVVCTGLAGGTWVAVPGDASYGTSDFCVMKYFASNVSSAPYSQTGTTGWTSISRTTAISECSSLGANYHLVTNPEWMTITANAAGQASNWSGGSVGSGVLARGHSDNTPASYCGADANDANAYIEASCTGGTMVSTGDTFEQRRTHTLSNGSVVWDLAGSYWQWINYTNTSDIPHSGGASYVQYTAFTGTTTTPRAHVAPQNSTHSYWSDSWNATQSIGNYYPGTNGASEGAMVRGGGKNIGTDGGIFAIRMSYGASDSTQANITFRCAYTP